MRDLLQIDGSERIDELTWLADRPIILFTRQRTDRALPAAERMPSLWALDVSTGGTRSLGLARDGLRNLAVRPDGRCLAFTAGWPTHELWQVENFLK